MAVMLGVLISVVATFVYRPWTVTWVDAWSGMEMDPLVVIGYWCGGLLAFTLILGFLGSLFGSIIDHTQEGRRK
jgi:hypothetical protein